MTKLARATTKLRKATKLKRLARRSYSFPFDESSPTCISKVPDRSSKCIIDEDQQNRQSRPLRKRKQAQQEHDDGTSLQSQVDQALQQIRKRESLDEEPKQ